MTHWHAMGLMSCSGHSCHRRLYTSDVCTFDTHAHMPSFEPDIDGTCNQTLRLLKGCSKSVPLAVTLGAMSTLTGVVGLIVRASSVPGQAGGL